MVNVNNSSAQNPMMDALNRLTGSVFGEARRAAAELGQNAVTDINSIGTAVETGGFLGGVLQAFDKLSIGNASAQLLDAATGPVDQPAGKALRVALAGLSRELDGLAQADGELVLRALGAAHPALAGLEQRLDRRPLSARCLSDLRRRLHSLTHPRPSPSQPACPRPAP
jgi:hypothetical protein